jgi:hypothetical protein
VHLVDDERIAPPMASRSLLGSITATLLLITPAALPAEQQPGERNIRNLLESWSARLADAGGKALLQGYMAVVDANLETASPLPDPVRRALAALIGRPGIPFAAADVEAARWTKSDKPVARVLFPQTYGQSARAITHGNLILVNDDFLTGPPCEVTARWAHEVAHVFQNRRDGRVEFLDRYLRESVEKAYNDISYERDAYAAQRAAERELGCGK